MRHDVTRLWGCWETWESWWLRGLVNESCLVRDSECRELEDMFGTNFTGQILKKCSGDMKQIKAAILWPNAVRKLPWLWMWQRALHDLGSGTLTSDLHGCEGSDWFANAHAAERWGTMHGKGENPCHLCDTGPLQETRLIGNHILEKHWMELHLLEISAADLLTMSQ